MLCWNTSVQLEIGVLHRLINKVLQTGFLLYRLHCRYKHTAQIITPDHAEQFCRHGSSLKAATAQKRKLSDVVQRMPFQQLAEYQTLNDGY